MIFFFFFFFVFFVALVLPTLIDDDLRFLFVLVPAVIGVTAKTSFNWMLDAALDITFFFFLGFGGYDSLYCSIPFMAFFRYSVSCHFFFTAALILAFYASLAVEPLDLFCFIALTIYSRKAGSCHFCLSALDIFDQDYWLLLPAFDFLIFCWYLVSSAHFFFKDSLIFCFVSSLCENPFYSRFFTSPLAWFSFDTSLIFSFVSSVNLYPPLALFLALRSASFFLLSSFFLALSDSDLLIPLRIPQ